MLQIEHLFEKNFFCKYFKITKIFFLLNNAKKLEFLKMFQIKLKK